MHKLYDLKDMLCKELEEYANKTTLDLNTLDVIDKLAHAIKNICKIIDWNEQDENMYSGARYNANMRYSGRNIHRDNMGRYSKFEDDYHMDFQKLIDEAPNEHIRQKLMNVMNEI